MEAVSPSEMSESTHHNTEEASSLHQSTELAEMQDEFVRGNTSMRSTDETRLLDQWYLTFGVNVPPSPAQPPR
jgi:hypothetical protein